MNYWCEEKQGREESGMVCRVELRECSIYRVRGVPRVL
jgi:hypothetical protein